MNVQLNRGSFAAGAAALLAAGGPANAEAAEFEYKFAHDLPIDHPLHVRLVAMWDDVRRETGGRLNVRLFPFGQLGAGPGLVDVLRIGSVQFASTASFLWSGVVPTAAIDAVGFLFTDVRQAFKLMSGPLGEFVRRAFAARGLYAFPQQWDLGLRQVTSSTKPLRNLADLAGFRIRTPAAKVSFDLFQTLGASPTVVDSNAMYAAMETHIVDGQETPYLTIETFRFFEVQKYLSVTNHQWTGYWVVANADAWQALPPDVRSIVSRNMAKYVELERKDVALQNQALVDKLQRQGLRFNLFDRTGVREKLAPYYARWKADMGASAWDLLEAGVGRLG